MYYLGDVTRISGISPPWKEKKIQVYITGNTTFTFKKLNCLVPFNSTTLFVRVTHYNNGPRVRVTTLTNHPKPIKLSWMTSVQVTLMFTWAWCKMLNTNVPVTCTSCLYLNLCLIKGFLVKCLNLLCKKTSSREVNSFTRYSRNKWGFISNYFWLEQCLYQYLLFMILSFTAIRLQSLSSETFP